jgi:hypothetical protein
MHPAVSAEPLASQTLALRIDRLLARLEHEAKQLDRRVGECVELAIECLKRGATQIGQDALEYAERAVEAPWEEQNGIFKPFPVDILRHQLETVRRAAGV